MVAIDSPTMAPKEDDLFDDRVCDESKCISKGTSNLNNGSFTCYGDDGTFYPMMCADGFLPVIANDQPPLVVKDIGGAEDVFVWYFTCCPPDLSPEATAAVTRHCSDPISATEDFDEHDGASLLTICDGQETFKYPRAMKSHPETSFNWLGQLKAVTLADSYLCCDSSPTVGNGNETSVAVNFLDDSECVPFRNDFYDAAKVKNRVGELPVISCDFSDGDFRFPRSVGEGASNTIDSTGRYQCCKNGPALPPFLQDSVFRATAYSYVIIYCVAAAISAIMVAGLLIPFLIQLRNGSYRRASLRMSHQRSASRARVEEPCYSTFNLYLVHLSIFDLILALYALVAYGSIIKQKFNIDFYSLVICPSALLTPWHSQEWAIALAHALANFWINAIISYQVLVLLQTSRRAVRINQPSLTRVNLQVGAVYFAWALFLSCLYSLQEAARKAEANGNFEKSQALLSTFLLVSILSTWPPTGYIVYVGVLVWWRGLMPSTNGITSKGKAMRELAFYFFRIIATFIVLWIPAIVLSTSVLLSRQKLPLAFCSAASGLQTLVMTCVTLTKSDVRKYIKNLLTCSYLSGNCATLLKSENDNGGLRDRSRTSRTRSFSMGETTKELTKRESLKNKFFLAALASKAFSITGASRDIVVDDDSQIAEDEDVDNPSDAGASVDSDAELEPETEREVHFCASRPTRDRGFSVLSTGEMVSVEAPVMNHLPEDASEASGV